MKRQELLILGLMWLSVILFVIFTKAGNNYLSYKEALNLGEEMYLKFLWIVDGAFNEKRMDGDYSVNGIKLDKDKKIFTCDYSKKDKGACIGKNFTSEFMNLFASNIKYEHVYGDRMTFTWFKYQDGKYYFTNPTNCVINRMNLEQELTIKEISENKIIYNINYASNSYNHISSNEFILVKEDSDWKISEAYYYDLCEMQYHIE